MKATARRGACITPPMRREGYWFRTPEAWEIDGHYRASMYMRPAAIWAMEMTAPPK